MDVVGPNNFCVVKDSMTPELQALKDDMNLVSATNPVSCERVISLFETDFFKFKHVFA